MGRQHEGMIVDSGIALLRARGAAAIKIHGGVFSRVGEPDVIGSYQGRAFAIEVKQSGEQPRRNQLLRLLDWQRAGATVGVAECDEDFLNIAIRRVSNLDKYLHLLRKE